jgi:hypothetical protein
VKRVAAKSLLVVSALSMVGCGTSGSSARATLQALVSATRAPDPARALYDLMPESARRAESLDAFRARVGSDPRSLVELRDSVAAALSGRRR